MRRRSIKKSRADFNKIMNNPSPAKKEKLRLVENMANDLMKAHCLSNYSFRFGYGWRYLGRCTEKSITINLNHTLHGDLGKIKDTILHEIAHALVGISNGHHLVWQNKAKELGVTWNRNYHK